MGDFDAETWERLVTRAEQAEASDIHLAPGAPIFFRIYGNMEEAGDGPTSDEITALIDGWTTPAQKERLQKQGELDLAREEKDVRLRVHAFSARGGTALSVRLVPKKVPALDLLGVPPVFQRLLALRSGLVLVSGKTGAGKTTTLAAFLAAVAQSRPAHIITLEDPIEYVHVSGKSLIGQRELGVHFSSFGGAIRSALREDPDVLMVGELRDADAAQAALSAAETGQLVLASLHTRTAAEAVHRLESFFPAAQQQEIRAQLAAVLEAMISQELLPGKDGKRALASEVLVATDAVRHLIRSGKPEQLASCIVSGASFGMQTMRQDIERLAAQNKISAETARRRLGNAK